MKLYPYWLKNSLYHFREFLWPLIDKNYENEIVSNEAEKNVLELFLLDENLKKAFDLNVKISESEESRRSSVESKATSLIGTISISSSLVVAANTITINATENLNAVRVSVVLSFILTLYTVRTVWFSIKALERKTYHVIDFSDINIGGNESEYFKTLILKLSKMTEKNETVINEKVNSLVLAQEYYKRSIVIICLYAFLVFIYCIFIK